MVIKKNGSAGDAEFLVGSKIGSGQELLMGVVSMCDVGEVSVIWIPEKYRIEF